jgi:RNA polymerase sigma-70 factor (ECF subfamily)
MNTAPTVELLSDEELALKVTHGSLPSFEELVARYSTRLFYFLRHRTETDQDIEDLVQETFLKAFKAMKSFNPECKFSTWLYTIAVRQAISRYRTNKKMKANPAATPHIPEPEEIVIKKEESNNLWRIASNLPKKEFEALWLHYSEDMPVKEIAKITKKKPITVRVLLHRARLNLARIIDRSELSEQITGASPVKHKYSIL